MRFIMVNNLFLRYFLFLSLSISLNLNAQMTPVSFWNRNLCLNCIFWDATLSNGTINDGSGNWSTTSTNFTSNSGATNIVYPNSSKLNFGGGINGTAGTVTISGTVNVDSLNFIKPFSGNYTLSGGTINLVNTHTISNELNADSVISSVISGADGLYKLGIGQLTLSGANTYTGKTFVNDGTLLINLNGAYTGGFDVGISGRLIQNVSMPGGYPGMGTVNIYGNGASSLNGFYVGNYTNAYLSLVNGPTTIRKYSGASGTAVLAGFDINGTHLNCTAAASGSIIDSTVQLISGGYGYTIKADAGTVPLAYDLDIQGHINANSSIGLFLKGTGTIKLSGDFASGNLINTANLAKLIIGNAFVFNSGSLSTTTIQQGSATIDWATSANNLITGDWTGTGQFLKSGSGSLTLSGGTRSYSGPITISAGTLKAGSLNAFGTATITCASTCTPATCIINKNGFAITNSIVNSSNCNIIP